MSVYEFLSANSGYDTHTTFSVGGGEEKMVAITFDDGPNMYTAKLLDILQARPDVKVTLYVLGNQINRYASDLRKMVENGHDVGVHGWNHTSYFEYATPLQAIQEQIERTAATIFKATKRMPTSFRPPYGDTDMQFNNRIAKMCDLAVIMWSHAPEEQGVPRVEQMQNIRSGDVILLHERDSTIKVLPALIDALAAEGYKMVTITELLERTRGAKQNKCYKDAFD